MQAFIILLVLIMAVLSSAGQKVRHVRDESTFLCKGDSIEHSFLKKLKLQGVDTIITALYDFDNGRAEHSRHNIFWVHHGGNWLRSFTGCDHISADTTMEVNIKELFAYIGKAKFKGTEEAIETELYMSHNMGYFISISLPHRKININVRDYQRSKIAGNEKAQSDSRVILTNRIDSLLNQSTSANIVVQ
jgi:hypothetical protein